MLHTKSKIALMFALCTAAAVLLALTAAGPSSTAGPPTVAPLKALCLASGGTFYDAPWVDLAVCDSNIPQGIVLPEAMIEAARSLCTQAYDTWFAVSGPPGYPSWYCGFVH